MVWKWTAFSWFRVLNKVGNSRSLNHNTRKRTRSSLGFRATSHMSQEPWPCNYGEDPWLPSKGCTMGVGKVVLCSQGPSSIVWSSNGPCCSTIQYFVDGKRWEDLVQYNMSQNSTNLRELLGGVCLSILESIMECALKFVMLEKIVKKLMVSRNLRQAHLLVEIQKFRETMKPYP